MSTHLHQQASFKQYFLSLFNAVYTTVKGMYITFRYVWGVKAVSIEYPEVREVLPERARMRLFNDAENCISCTQCAMACPVDCIYITSEKQPEGAEIKKTTSGQPIRLKLTQFTIDTALCCYCGLCTTVCPTECLTHSHDYEFAQYTIDAMKYDYISPDVRAWRDRIVK
ncbi:MAG: 4Fe-4S binding protein [Bacteriovoracaceae bacterium]|jgi:NADH-quinone oxidoreductase subunit I